MCILREEDESRSAADGRRAAGMHLLT
eukprot:COSAG06_NODE_38319_length_425_cov_0.346626_2_plen_26_part_01